MLLYVAAAKVTANAPDKTKFAAMAKRLATDSGIVGRRPRAPAPRRLRLSPGLSDRALLARPARPFDPRGHQPGHANDRQPGADCGSDHRPDPPPDRGRAEDDERPSRRCRSTRSPSPRRPSDIALGLADAAAGPDPGADGRGAAVGRFLDRRAERQGRRQARATAASPRPNGRTTLITAALRDAYLLASEQLRELVVARRRRRRAARRWSASCSTNISTPSRPPISR